MGSVIVAASMAILWFGLCIGMIWYGVTEREHPFSAIGVVLAALGIGLGMAIKDENESEHILLAKSRWTCTDTRVFMQPVLVGKVIINQPRRECVEYRRG